MVIIIIIKLLLCHGFDVEEFSVWHCRRLMSFDLVCDFSQVLDEDLDLLAVYMWSCVDQGVNTKQSAIIHG